MVEELPNHLPFVDSVLASMKPGEHMSRLEIHRLACQLANRDSGSGTGASWARIHHQVTSSSELAYIQLRGADDPLRVVRLLPD